MRSRLTLRSPSNGTGWQDLWAFSGADERALRDCLDQLDAFAIAPPVERWDPARHRTVIDAKDRWAAAVLLHPGHDRRDLSPDPAEAAWTADGARHLAELLPESLNDLREAILQRFVG